MPQEIQLFADKQIRTYWDDDKELYYFCIVDVVDALTDSNDPKQYIKRMRQRDRGAGRPTKKDRRTMEALWDAIDFDD